jgi:hypothetical protein
MKKKIFLVIVAISCSLGCEPMKEEEPSLEGGTLKTTCFNKNNSTTYTMATASFSNGNYLHIYKLYSDSSCTLKYLELTENGSYEIINETSTKFDALGDLDLTLGQLKVTPASSTVVTQYNQLSLCGFTDWALNVAKEVTGLTCGSDQMTSSGTKYYDIFRITKIPLELPGSTTKKDDINFGAPDSSNDGSTAEKRPKATQSPAYRR